MTYNTYCAYNTYKKEKMAEIDYSKHIKRDVATEAREALAEGEDVAVRGDLAGEIPNEESDTPHESGWVDYHHRADDYLGAGGLFIYGQDGIYAIVGLLYNRVPALAAGPVGTVCCGALCCAPLK